MASNEFLRKVERALSIISRNDCDPSTIEAAHSILHTAMLLGVVEVRAAGGAK